jgi:general secretion pathway protein G
MGYAIQRRPARGAGDSCSTTLPDTAHRLSAGHDNSPEPTQHPEDTGLARVPGAPRCRLWSALTHPAGFTLVELLVVIIVLGLLVGLVGPRLFGRVGQSKTAAARAQIELLGAALDQYRLDAGRYPDTAQGLDALQRNPGLTSWNGPYLRKDVPKDPWGNPYKYRCCPGQHGDYDLWSDGGDGAPGGEGENADVTSWTGEQQR